MKTRLYYRESTGQWLQRIDGNSPLSIEEAEAHCAEQFGLPVDEVQAVETDGLTESQVDALRTAVDWAGVPPQTPQPSDVVIPTGSGLVRPTPIPTPPDPDDELTQAIEGASTIAQLKDALLGRVRPARVRAETVEGL